MIRVTPFETWHLELLLAQGVQPSQARASHVLARHAKVAKPVGTSLTAWDDDGRVLITGGVMAVDNTCGTLWAVLSAHAGCRMLAVHRGLSRFLDSQPQRRIEATVEAGFAPGCRWLELLGFEFEGHMRGYGDNGETHERYALVRGI